MIKVRVIESILSGWEIQNSIQSPKEIQTQKNALAQVMYT